MRYFFEGFNATELLFLGGWGFVWYGLAALVAVVLVGFTIYDFRHLSRSKIATLALLRTAILVLAVLILSEPTLELKQVSRSENTVGVMVDESGSMSMQTAGGQSRFDKAKQLLRGFDQLEQSAQGQHSFRYFKYGDGLHSSTRKSLVSQDAADAAESDLTSAFSSLTETVPRNDLGGVVVLTDGIDTGGIGQRTQPGEALDSKSKEHLEGLSAPINTVVTGDATELTDLGITKLKYDTFAFAHNKTTVHATIQAYGLDGETVSVVLRRAGEVVRKEKLQLSDGTGTYELEFEFVPKKVGERVYSVTVPELSNEATHKNNRRRFLINVVRDKIRVLQVVGQPSWDERFLRRYLKTNPNVELISFFILRTREDVQLVPSKELSLIPFPTRELFEEQLGSFDLVIFQNFNFRPYGLSRYLESVAQYVRDGGAFAMLGGKLSFASGGYRNSPIADLLPMALPAGGSSSSLINTDHFHPELTSVAENHPITRFLHKSGRSMTSKLPAWRGTNVVGPARKDATVLARHPELKAGKKSMPVAAIREAREGRVLAATTDSLWRWGFEAALKTGTTQYFSQFWNSAIPWLIKDPDLKLVRIETERNQYSRGDTIDVQLDVSRPNYEPAPHVTGTLSVFHRRPSEAGEMTDELLTKHSFETSEQGRAFTAIKPSKPGVYKLVATARTPDGTYENHDFVHIEDRAREFRLVSPRPKLLEQISGATGGVHQTAAQFDPSQFQFEKPGFGEIKQRRVISLWNHPLVYFLIVLLLGAEWLLRRRWGLM